MSIPNDSVTVYNQLAAMQRALAENGDFLSILNAFFYDETGAMGGIVS